MRKFLDKIKPHFDADGKFRKFHSLYEMMDTFLYTPSDVTTRASHIRDGIDLKRIMITVVAALIPATIMACYNTGLQANLALSELAKVPTGWRPTVMSLLGLGFNPASIADDFVYGMLYFFPVYMTAFIAGGAWETIFAVIRNHEITEGFLVTSLLFPLILPPTIPLWQVALGISFAVVIGKEVFGGTGMNVFNPALVGRAFLFFSYPAQMTGDAVWVAVDGYTHTTPLALLANSAGSGTSAFLTPANWQNAFWGFIPGSMGETSTFAILIGAAWLIFTGIGSWRIMLSVVISMAVMSLMFNLIAMKDANPAGLNAMFMVTPAWHFVLGGFAFGTVFMATDPVSAAMTNMGKYLYGMLIGFMVVLIRVVNPAFPEGMMLAILFANAFAPVIDYFVVQKNIKRRKIRNAAR